MPRLRVGVVLLPRHPWERASRDWIEVDEAGFDHAWTYDHVLWPQAGAGAWHEAISTLAAAAVVTDRINLGCMVFSPNLRHPATLAKAAATVADIASGRLTLGIGAGSAGVDSALTGNETLSPADRLDRLSEFVLVVRELLERGRCDHRGRHFTAVTSGVEPTHVVDGRAPIVLAANGPRAMSLAADQAAGWVTDGEYWAHKDPSPSHFRARARRLIEEFKGQCERQGRPMHELRRYLLLGPGPEPVFSQPGALLDAAHAYADMGYTDLVVHHPSGGELFPSEPDIYEQVLSEDIAELQSIVVREP